MSTHTLQRAVRASYDAIAEEYASRLDGELVHKPFDRQLLDAFAAQTKHGLVADLGCGPGMATQYLHDAGVRVLGMDLSPRMVQRATSLHPALKFECGDFTRLEVLDGAWSGIVALYSLIHLPREAVQDVLRDFFRVLSPGGSLLLAFHVGSEIRHASDWWDKPVELDFVFFQMAEMLSYVWGAGFDTEVHTEREPYPEIEVQTQRGYILAKKPLAGLIADA